MTDHEELTAFTKAVHDAVRRIPPGQVRTYKEVAVDAGRSEGAARAVGTVMAKNAKRCYLAYETGGEGAPTYEEVVPCHRVVAAGGRHTGYLGEISERAIKYRKDLLEKERMHAHLERARSKAGSEHDHPFSDELRAFRAEHPEAPLEQFYGDWLESEATANAMACAPCGGPSAKRAKPSE